MEIPFSPSRLDATIFLKKNLKKYLISNYSVIDIGCGALYLPYLLDLLKIKLNYLGIDTNPKKTKFQSTHIKTKIVKGDILNFKTKQKFDIAACLWTLEHIKNHQSVCKKIFGLSY